MSTKVVPGRQVLDFGTPRGRDSGGPSHQGLRISRLVPNFGIGSSSWLTRKCRAVTRRSAGSARKSPKPSTSTMAPSGSILAGASRQPFANSVAEGVPKNSDAATKSRSIASTVRCFHRSSMVSAPRLSPNRTNLGRRPLGIPRRYPVMACIRARFCSIAKPVRVRDIDEGSREYCMVAMALFPNVRYSMVSAVT